LLAKVGKSQDFDDAFAFEEPTVSRWIQNGSKPILAFTTGDHELLDHRAMARRRIGSLLLVPIVSGHTTIGLISLCSAAHGALGPEEARIVQDVAAELAHTMESVRLRRSGSEPCHGILTVSEFQREVLQEDGGSAALVYIEPLHLEENLSKIGAPSIELAARQLGMLCRRHGPKNAKICRKAGAGFVVLLPGATVEQAQAWANEISALAAMRSVDSSDKHIVIPLAVRVRVADLNAKPEEKKSEEIVDSRTVTS
jgi:hypothetical protein